MAPCHDEHATIKRIQASHYNEYGIALGARLANSLPTNHL
jgi:hypothetical protein